MVRRSQNSYQQELKATERRFRFRARFEQPPGGGRWIMEDNLLKWLNERVGKDAYAFRTDEWEGHGPQCYALHFDDHTIIPDLMAHYATIETVIYREPCFHGQLPRLAIASVRDAVLGLQNAVVDNLNTAGERVIWTMGKCTFAKWGMDQTAWEIAQISRINELTEICSILSVSSSEEVVRFTLESDHVGALTICLTVVRDLKPPPNHVIVPLRDLLNSLVEDKGGYDVRSVQR